MSVEVIKDAVDRDQFDASVVTGQDPAYVYRWARKDQKNLLMHGVHGYEKVEPFLEKSILGDNTRVKQGESQTTAIEWGDMVLMRTPKANYEKRLGREREMILRRTRGVTANYRAAMASITGNHEAAYEEHKDNRSMTGMNAEEFKKEMSKSPEEERS